jgi:hypothetical protein
MSNILTYLGFSQRSSSTPVVTTVTSKISQTTQDLTEQLRELVSSLGTSPTQQQLTEVQILNSQINNFSTLLSNFLKSFADSQSSIISNFK